jgi:hypothetical protein
MISDNTRIGILMVSLGFLFLFLGILLFFDSGFLAIGNILFLGGIPFIIGFQPTLKFFNPTRKGKARGVICFFLGVLLVLVRWPLIGMIVEVFGMFEMFGTFLPIVVNFLRGVPYVGQVLSLPVVSTVIDKLAGARERRPPV